MAFFEVKNLTKSFGGLTAVRDLSFQIEQGELMAIIGPNGAGKTTLFNLITGALPLTNGQIVFEGRDITGLRPDEISKRGVVRTFQAPTLFPDLTVSECISVAYHLSTHVGFSPTLFGLPSYQQQEERVGRDSIEILRHMGLDSLRGQLSKNLPHGHQRALGVALAVAASPKLLLLDEPVTGMTPEEVVTMMKRITGLCDRGITVCLVEHNMRAVMGFCRRILVLSFGQRIAEGSPEEIGVNRQVIEAYLGAAEEAV